MVGRGTFLIAFFIVAFNVVSALAQSSSFGALIGDPRRTAGASKKLGSNEFELATNPLAAITVRQLYARQGSTCPSGYGSCRNHPTDCCPIGGVCCVQTSTDTVTGCCPSGQFCYSGGCCDDGTTGCGGESCCPSGAACCGSSCCQSGETCSSGDVCCPAGRDCVTSCPSGQVECQVSAVADFSVCCAPGAGCSNDSSGLPVCNTGSSPPPGTPPPGTPPPGTPPPSTTPPTTSTTPPPTTSSAIPTQVESSDSTTRRGPTTTIFPSSGSSGPDNTIASFTMSIPPEPSPDSRSHNISIAADDPSILYSNGVWNTTSACQVSVKQTNDVGGQMDCQFVGTAIYISTLVGTSGGIFTATIDGNSVDVNTFRTSSTGDQCAITWSQWGLANQQHTVRVVYRGASTEQGAAPGPGIQTTFGITRFTVTAEDDNSSDVVPVNSPPKDWRLYLGGFVTGLALVAGWVTL